MENIIIFKVLTFYLFWLGVLYVIARVDCHERGFHWYVYIEEQWIGVAFHVFKWIFFIMIMLVLIYKSARWWF